MMVDYAPGLGKRRKIMYSLVVIDSDNTVLVYDSNDSLIGYFVEHFESKHSAMEYASQFNTQIVFEG